MSKNSFKILFIGDIVGRPGRRAVAHFVPLLKEKERIDFVIANGENLAGGTGMTLEKYQEMLDVGVDYFTSGNHIWKNRDIIPYLKDGSAKILRPANFQDNPPGQGVVTLEVDGEKLTIINLIGRIFIPGVYDDPFVIGKQLAEANKDSIIIVDIHAEATSEKVALGYYLDGEAAAVIGTHTHIQTADEQILPKGTAYITDVGMCGPKESVLGVNKEIIIHNFLTTPYLSHKVAVGDSIFNAAILEIDRKTKKAVSVRRIYETLENHS